MVHELGRGRERRQNPKQAPGSEQAVSTEHDKGLKLKKSEIMTWAEVGGSTEWALQVPRHDEFLKDICTYFNFMRYKFYGANLNIYCRININRNKYEFYELFPSSGWITEDKSLQSCDLPKFCMLNVEL